MGTAACLALVLLLAVAAGAAAQIGQVGQTPDPLASPRQAEPIVLRGADIPDWSARSNQTARIPFVDLIQCPVPNDDCRHNEFSEPDFDSGGIGNGVPVNQLLAYRWTGSKFDQIPFQVDEQFTRYLSNQASGFSFYSGEDQHTTYAYDREGFRYTQSDPSNPCLARPSNAPTVDPVEGLDDNDELAFMASDAGPRAPAGNAPQGIDDVKEIPIRDPANPSGETRYVYVMRALTNGPKPAFSARNGYVSYKRDAISDTFEKSESSYSDYGNAERGPYCDAEGRVITDDDPDKPGDQPARRRPRDYATIKTDRYRFRYDGRWLMTEIGISGDGGTSYGPDVVDRWKARAFQQDPGSETPCCGFEEEDTNWGGSGTLLGERVGPVRAIRETWGADSSTNAIRRESFYRDEMRMKSWLRVHVIPPLDGIYAQWDFNAGRMSKFFNTKRPDGVTVDGQNDEVFGNLDDPCNQNYDLNDTSFLDQTYRSAYEQFKICDASPYHQSVDLTDPTLQEANAALGWSEVAGPHGTIVDRYTSDVRDVSPGGTAQSGVAMPYYRDDSCFDDGTGTDPGPKVKKRSGDEPRTAADGTDRRCWKTTDGLPNGSDHFFQGSIATHGVHILFIADSDNARQTVPVNEIVSENRLAMLPPVPGADPQNPPSRGAEFGAAFDQPLVASPDGSSGNVQVRPDRTRPSVKLKARVHNQHKRIHLTWAGRDKGGSGIDHYALQVRKGKGRWRTVNPRTRKHTKNFKAKVGVKYTFRVRAVDRAGNRSKASTRSGRVKR